MFDLDNSEPLLKKKPPSNDTPVHMSSFGSKQQCGSSFSKINVKSNAFIYLQFKFKTI